MSTIEDSRRWEFRRMLAYSGVAHLVLLLGFTFSPRPAGISLPAVVRVDLVAAVPTTAKPAPVEPRPVPIPEPPKPKKKVLPAKPTRPPKPKPKPKPKPEPAPEPQVDYDDFLAKLREQAGEAEKPTQVAGARSAFSGSGRGIPVTPEVMAWMRSAKVHVTRAWVLAPGFRTQPLSTEIRVQLSSDGEVLRTRVVRRSGNPWYDESVERAIKKASPLPPPPKADEWIFVFRPEDVLR